MKILVLGHNGMLGHMVIKYLSSLNIEFKIIKYRWPSINFKKEIINSNCDYLINCISCIPQKNTNWNNYKNININLPLFLIKNFKNKIIQPTSDCEFSGTLKYGCLYEKNDVKDVTDDYGISKCHISNILISNSNVKQIRTSIIGPEIYNNVSLMEWFFKQTNKVNGFSNHYWNGITSLEWSKQSLYVIKNWNDLDNVVQIGTKSISKYNLLCLINKIFKCKKDIVSIDTNFINRCLKSDYILPDIEKQLIELKRFYKKTIV